MGAGRAGVRLGALLPDSTRSIVVISADGELAVAIRDSVDRAVALVRDVRPDEATEAIAACLPWPWMVVGDIDAHSSQMLAPLRRWPVITFWRGVPPPGLRSDARGFALFADLMAAIHDASSSGVGDMRLASCGGVELPDGTHIRSAALQALVSFHAHGFHIAQREFRGATRALARHDIAWRPGRSPGDGTIRLQPHRSATQYRAR